MEYTSVDRALCAAVSLWYPEKDNPSQPEYQFEFQFPPRITSDSRSGEWSEPTVPGTEPVANFMRSGPREITLIWTYIVDGGRWTTTKIAGIVRQLRGYFARIKKQSDHRGMIVKFKMWRLGGNDNITCRIKNVSVKHSETIIVPNINNQPQIDLAYPLRTDITVDLRLWTQGGPPRTNKLLGLASAEPEDWY